MNFQLKDDLILPPYIFILEDDNVQRENLEKNIVKYFKNFDNVSLPSKNDIVSFPSYDVALENLLDKNIRERPLIGILDYDMTGAEELNSRKPSSALIHNLMIENQYDPRLILGIIYSGRASEAFQDPIFGQLESDLRNRGNQGSIPTILRLNKGSAAELGKDVNAMCSIIGYTCQELARASPTLVKEKYSDIAVKSSFDLYEFGRNLNK